MISRTFKLCLNAGNGSAPYINVNQYDEGETWLFELYSENGERYIPSSGAIVGVKSDGHGIANTGTVDSEGRVVIAETQQMTASAGRAIYELSIDGLTHGTANFIVAVERKPTDDAVMSDSDLSLIQEAVDSAAVIVDVIGDSDPSEVIGEHVDDWLDAHPEATTTVQDGAITAPKINQSLWDKLLVSEEASGAVASFEDGADDIPVSSLKVALEPIQTGSGDPSPSNIRPIVASNGKNMIPITLANLQTINTGGTWNGNAYTYRGVTYTVNTNGGGGVISITANGTATYESSLALVTNINALLTVGETYTMTGCPSGGASGTYWCAVGTTPSNGRILADYGSGATTTYTSQYDQTTRNAYVAVARDYTAVNVTFMPQIEIGSSVSAYQPYQGILVERTGKNLLQITATSQTFRGVTFTVDADGTVTANGTATSAVWYPLGTVTLDGEYIINGSPSGGSMTTYALVSQGVETAYDFGYGATVTYDGTSKSVYIYMTTGTTVNNLVFKPMIRRADVADDTFEPYIGTSYPYSLGQTVYGGTVDLATGVLTVTKGIKIYDGTETWGTENTYNFYSGTGRGTGVQDNGYLCSHFHFTGILANSTDTTKMPSAYISASGNFNVQRADIEHTAEAMKQWCLEQYQAGTPLTVVFNLNAPITVQLTPTEVKTLLGYNNISSGGTVDVIYHADTKLYVDKMTAVDNNIIAPTEETFTATRNYTTNDLVIVNDTLYKVTANIASGSAITPNSNVQQTTLGALIKALS